MKKLLFNNTYKSGHMSYLVFKSGRGYTAVCLEFDLVINADTMEEAKSQIEELSKAWLENVIKNKLPEELLNKRVPVKYSKMFDMVTCSIKEKTRLKKPAFSKSHMFGSFETYTPTSLLAL